MFLRTLRENFFSSLYLGSTYLICLSLPPLPVLPDHTLHLAGGLVTGDTDSRLHQEEVLRAQPLRAASEELPIDSLQALHWDVEAVLPLGIGSDVRSGEEAVAICIVAFEKGVTSLLASLRRYSSANLILADVDPPLRLQGLNQGSLVPCVGGLHLGSQLCCDLFRLLDHALLLF